MAMEQKPDDRPESCEYCYFWLGKKKGCGRPECFYQLPGDTADDAEAGNLKETSCDGCPYGKNFPCIGYCLEQIIRELRERGHAK